MYSRSMPNLATASNCIQGHAAGMRHIEMDRVVAGFAGQRRFPIAAVSERHGLGRSVQVKAEDSLSTPTGHYKAHPIYRKVIPAGPRLFIFCERVQQAGYL